MTVTVLPKHSVLSLPPSLVNPIYQQETPQLAGIPIATLHNV